MFNATLESPPKTAARPPRGERFADPVARAVWAALAELDRGHLHAVYRRLGEMLATNEATSKGREAVRLARAVDALNEAADKLAAEGGSEQLSQRTYERLRKEHTTAGWPPQGTVRRWCGGGSWNDCLRRAQLDPVREGEAVARCFGGGFTQGELVEAIDEAERDIGHLPTSNEYRSWARREDVRSRPGRRPLSQGPFDREFGSWSAALVAAGGGVDQGPSPAVIRPSEPAAVPYRKTYSMAEILEAMRKMASRIDGPLTRTRYTSERAAFLRERAAEGLPPIPVPSQNTISVTFPSWAEALEAAGLPPANGVHHKRAPQLVANRSKRFSDEEIFEILRRAHAEAAVDGRLKLRHYRDWRKQRLAEAAAAGRYELIPEIGTIQARFGGYVAALRQALAADARRSETDG